MTDREKLIELLKGFSFPVTVNGEPLSEWTIPMPQIRKALADHLLANGVTFAKDTDVPSKWISVKEQMPEYDRKVLITDVRDGYISIAELKCGGKILVDCWDCDDTIRLPVSEITHWQELPQPPREE